jgi:hypothetical protein
MRSRPGGNGALSDAQRSRLAATLKERWQDPTQRARWLKAARRNQRKVSKPLPGPIVSGSYIAIMRPLIGSLAGGGSAAAASLASWPLIVMVANAQLVAALALPAAAGELVWGLSIGVLGGIVGTFVGGQASNRAWPSTAYGSWFIWSLLLMALTAMRFLPVLFTLSAVIAAGATAFAFTRMWRPGPQQLTRAPILTGVAGFTLLVVALIALLFVAMNVRPNGVTPEVWRAYMNTMDLVAMAAVAVFGIAASAIGALRSRHLADGLVSLATYVGLVVLTTPFFGFYSSCYAGQAFIIFSWLGSPTC